MKMKNTIAALAALMILGGCGQNEATGKNDSATPASTNEVHAPSSRAASTNAPGTNQNPAAPQ